ncbi:isochorismatase family protein [Ramlibacter sp. Leaf400]|uniref:isochorismatase family protein n=1 Tax=Ramlibacter sp. Leaf400 TaxID=1736365 RepID=UPI0006F84BDD|nr:isochorismatase family protein [Ramlibacter sp. Leaf400]KQT11252.1 N-carbamoylsarcosine amidase [Ramlibacter sp. Leaf400]
MSGRDLEAAKDLEVYRRQGLGGSLGRQPPFGLLVVDFVRGFADPAQLGGGNIAQAIEASVPLLAAARAQGWPIAHSRIVYADDASDHNVFSEKIPGMRVLHEEADASQFVPQLAPMAGELVVRKTAPSAFFGTALAPWLTARGVRTLLVAGCTTSGCVRASVVDAMSWGFRPIVVEDCVGDRAIGPHDANLFDMRSKYADVAPWNAVAESIGIAA